MRKLHHTFLVLALAVVASADVCGKAEEPSGCFGDVKSLGQVGTTLVANGTFKEGQPILTLTGNGRTETIAANDYNSATAFFNIVGIPTGTYTVSLDMSCDKGGKADVTTEVTTITIQ
jgi:hypothetical protein